MPSLNEVSAGGGDAKWSGAATSLAVQEEANMTLSCVSQRVEDLKGGWFVNDNERDDFREVRSREEGDLEEVKLLREWSTLRYGLVSTKLQS